MKRSHTKGTAPVLLALALGVLVLGAALFSCELYSYGKLGGADQTETYYPVDDVFEDTMSVLSGVWYSHYAGMGRLDGYRIGTWKDFNALVGESKKKDLFPAMAVPYTTYTGTTFGDEDYFVLYDDTVFGQSDDGSGGNGGWDGLVTRYIGIVRAVNIFNGDPNRGAIIIEYLAGCAPGWLNLWPESSNGKRPFFGIYYRVLNRDMVQMANAVDLEALYAGKSYYTETASLQEAIDRNTVENEAEFISWGVVIPQNRE
ncbi:MAG: hypothetical protein LBP88_06885 [Treponema sp.]|jgi:hypothetical protein|nr:hypothetical protein [Treponema sp.]